MASKSGAKAPLTITWQCVRRHGLIAGLIGAFGGGLESGRFNHVDVVGPDGWLYGAQASVIRGIKAGTQRRPPNYEVWIERVQFTLPVSNTAYDIFWRFINQTLDDPYDTPGLIATYVLGENWRLRNGWWCSEWQAAGAERAGIIGHLWDGARQVTPSDWALILTALGAVARKMPIEPYHDAHLVLPH